MGKRNKSRYFRVSLPEVLVDITDGPDISSPQNKLNRSADGSIILNRQKLTSVFRPLNHSMESHPRISKICKKKRKKQFSLEKERIKNILMKLDMGQTKDKKKAVGSADPLTPGNPGTQNGDNPSNKSGSGKRKRSSEDELMNSTRKRITKVDPVKTDDALNADNKNCLVDQTRNDSNSSLYVTLPEISLGFLAKGETKENEETGGKTMKSSVNLSCDVASNRTHSNTESVETSVKTSLTLVGDKKNTNIHSSKNLEPSEMHGFSPLLECTKVPAMLKKDNSPALKDPSSPLVKSVKKNNKPHSPSRKTVNPSVVGTSQTSSNKDQNKAISVDLTVATPKRSPNLDFLVTPKANIIKNVFSDEVICLDTPAVSKNNNLSPTKKPKINPFSVKNKLSYAQVVSSTPKLYTTKENKDSSSFSLISPIDGMKGNKTKQVPMRSLSSISGASERSDDVFVTLDSTYATAQEALSTSTIDLTEEETIKESVDLTVVRRSSCISLDDDTVIKGTSFDDCITVEDDDFVDCTSLSQSRSASRLYKEILNEAKITHSSLVDTIAKKLLGSCYQPPKKMIGSKKRSSGFGSNIYCPDKFTPANGLRTVVIDGSNVAMSHFPQRKVFSVEGLKICIDYFLRMNHAVKAFVPRFRNKRGKSSNPSLLDDLERKGLVVYTPSREVRGRFITSYDDRYIIQCAAQLDGVVVSGDNFRDLLQENESWRETIESRLLPFTWVGNMIMFPQDPLGRNGPTLSRFLSH